MQKSPATKKTIALGVTGQVIWYNIHKVYGFIHCSNQQNDIFFHQSAIIEKKTSKSMTYGNVVNFDIV